MLNIKHLIAGASCLLSAAVSAQIPPTSGDGLFPIGTTGEIRTTDHTVELDEGGTLDVEAGWFFVPESRQQETGNHYALPFYRLKALTDTPGDPVFLIAGGPGSSWIDRVRYERSVTEIQGRNCCGRYINSPRTIKIFFYKTESEIHKYIFFTEYS